MLLVSLLGILSLFALVPGRPTYPRLLLLLANVAFVLQARRNVQLYAATVFPILALHFDAVVRQLPDWRGIRATFERDARRGTDGIFIVMVTAVMVAVAAFRGTVGPIEIVASGLDPKAFPVAAVERARQERLDGRIFHEFTWGGYLLYAWPEQKVFIDGGTDFYGPDLMRTFMETRGLKPGWRETLSKWKVSYLLMDPGSAIVSELVQDGEWGVRYCDETAVLLERDAAPGGAGGAGALARIEQCTADPGTLAGGQSSAR